MENGHLELGGVCRIACEPVGRTLGTWDRILEAAISLIESEGESAVRVDRVVELAGFTKPVLYRHFADKEDLIIQAQAHRYRTALEWGLDELLIVTPRLRTADELVGELRVVLSAFGTPEGERRRRVRIEVLGSALSRPALHVELQRANQDYVSRLSAFISMATTQGLMSPAFPPKDMAAWWVGLLLGRHIVEMDPETNDVDGWDAITDSVIRFLMAGASPAA